MEMRHIRTFLALADELHFGRAASRLGIAQPAVSAAIRQLEDEVGAVLFERTQRRVELSAAGRLLRPAVQDALASLERGVQSARRAARGETGTVVVHFTAIAALGRLPAALGRYRARRPDVQVRVRQLGTRDQLEALRTGRCDLGFTIQPGNVRPLRTAVVMRERLVAVLPRGHEAAAAPSVAFGQIAAEPTILLPRASEPAIAEAHRQLCLAHGVEPNIVMELDQIEAILAFVAAGLGVTFMPESVDRLRRKGVVTVPLSPRITAEATLVWDPARLSPAGRELLDEILREGGTREREPADDAPFAPRTSKTPARRRSS